MKAILCIAVALAVSVAAVNTGAVSEDEVSFVQWMSEHKRHYESRAEYLKRFDAFKQTMARINARSAAAIESGSSVTYGLNQFSDMTAAEFKQKMLAFRAAPAVNTMPQFDLADLSNPLIVDEATEFDWRLHGAVTPVKDQGNCGSCWAFSATEEIESLWFLQRNMSLPILAPQQIVDCDIWPTDQGCNGGTTQFAYEYVMDAGGIDSEQAYPYTSGDSGERGFCQYDKSSVQASVKSWAYATPVCADFGCNHQDEGRMEAALLANGPVSVCLNANAWQDYTSGVMDPTACGPHDLLSLDHCVQTVGFNKSNATAPAYWIVRNSWNTGWGVAGYIYLEMGQNTCGIANIATQLTTVD